MSRGALGRPGVCWLSAGAACRTVVGNQQNTRNARPPVTPVQCCARGSGGERRKMAECAERSPRNPRVPPRAGVGGYIYIICAKRNPALLRGFRGVKITIDGSLASDWKCVFFSELHLISQKMFSQRDFCRGKQMPLQKVLCHLEDPAVAVAAAVAAAVATATAKK